MVFIDRGNSPKGGKYLVCENGKRGVQVAIEGKLTKCTAHSVRYKEFEETMLNNLSRLRPENVLPNPSERTQQEKLLEEAIAGIVGEIAEKNQEWKNYYARIGKTKDEALQSQYEQTMRELKTKIGELEAEKKKKEADLDNLKRGAQDFAKWQHDLDGLKNAIAKDVDTRLRLRAHLKEFIDKVDIFPKGHEDSVEHADAIIDEMDLPQPVSRKFRSYVSRQLLSREGRFYGLHLRRAKPPLPKESALSQKGRKYQPWQPRTNKGLPIAPAGSLAGGFSIGPEGLRLHAPKLDKLAKVFFDGRKPGRFVPKASVV